MCSSAGQPKPVPPAGAQRPPPWALGCAGLIAAALLALGGLALAGLDLPPLLVPALALLNLAAIAWLGRRLLAARASRPAADAPVANHPLGPIVNGSARTAGQQGEVDRKQANIEKFAALGRLSAGVVHEINNPLGGILTCLEAMRTLEPDSERYEEYWTLAKEGLERIGTIVRQLLSFSRQPSGERCDVDTNDVVRDVVTLTSLDNRKNEIEVVHEAGIQPIVHGFPDLMNQLFLNLTLNAFQAMPDGGTLRIRTRVEEGEVVTTFEDSGPGVPEENLDRIFEPFFTTKEVGVGTGLGLSVAMGIVEAHGGSIKGENRPEGGARFTVRLPCAGRRGAHRRRQASTP